MRRERPRVRAMHSASEDVDSRWHSRSDF